MMDHEVHEVGGAEVTDDVTGELEFGVVWVLLWLVAKADRQATAQAIIGDGSNDAAGAESLRRWAEPQLVVFRRDEDVPLISWPQVARILRNHLPLAKG